MVQIGAYPVQREEEGEREREREREREEEKIYCFVFTDNEKTHCIFLFIFITYMQGIVIICIGCCFSQKQKLCFFFICLNTMTFWKVSYLCYDAYLHIYA